MCDGPVLHGAKWSQRLHTDMLGSYYHPPRVTRPTRRFACDRSKNCLTWLTCLQEMPPGQGRPKAWFRVLRGVQLRLLHKPRGPGQLHAMCHGPFCIQQGRKTVRGLPQGYLHRKTGRQGLQKVPDRVLFGHARVQQMYVLPCWLLHKLDRCNKVPALSPGYLLHPKCSRLVHYVRGLPSRLVQLHVRQYGMHAVSSWAVYSSRQVTGVPGLPAGYVQHY